MQVYSITDKGLRKPVNQDRFVVKKFQDGSNLIAVADGLSGQPAGDTAAEIARQCVTAANQDVPDIESHLVQLVHACDEKILQTAKKRPALAGMGTTLTVAFIKDTTVYWAHIGNCRLYLCRGEMFLQVTKDDTLAAYLLAEGKLTPEQARRDPSRHGLFECLGHGYAEVKSGRFSIQKGDLLLLSSDGLHDEISEENIHAILKSDDDLKNKMNRLVHASLDEGGSDNITAVGVYI